MNDLVILAADKEMQYALRGALNRPEALGTRPLCYDSFVHAGHDGGVRQTGPDLLRMKRRTATHALLILDYEGSGAASSAADLESELDRRLTADWGTAAKAIVIQPELEAWVWGADNVMHEILGWKNIEGARVWLRRHGFDFSSLGKPRRPKEAFSALLREASLPRSAAIFEEIASRISLQRCHDAAFLRLRKQLVDWFSAI
jgi:hypothetical protein